MNALTSKRKTVFESSLRKKEARFDVLMGKHFESVKAANGQPLNDKRNGMRVVAEWDEEMNRLRKQRTEIEKTVNAIDKEENKIASTLMAYEKMPLPIQEMIDTGEVTQWRKHPETMFVPGVDKGRIHYDAKTGILSHRYLSEIVAEQYPKFRDTFNKMNQALKNIRNS